MEVIKYKLNFNLRKKNFEIIFYNNHIKIKTIA